MTTYASVAELPITAIGSNGKSAILLSTFTATVTDIPALSNVDSQRIENLAIFRTGKFKDSEGREGEWTAADLDAMVENFYLLREKGIFPNVPVRENHSRDVRLLGGYFADLRRIGETLYADLEITEPDVFARYSRGTYRSRSLELGAYESNDGDIYFPVVMGVAFCDIPAVEGLFSAASTAYSGSEAEISVLEPESQTAGDQPDDLIAATQVVLAALSQSAAEPPAEIQKVIEAVTAHTLASGDTDMPDTFRFSHNGAEVELVGDDSTRAAFAALVAESEAKDTELVDLRAANEKSVEAARHAAVDGWLTAKKIAPAQVDSAKEYVTSLDAEQFAAYAKLQDAAPELSFTATTAGDGPDEEEATEREAAISIHAQTLRGLKSVGFSQEKLTASAAFKALVALGVTPEV